MEKEKWIEANLAKFEAKVSHVSGVNKQNAISRIRMILEDAYGQIDEVIIEEKTKIEQQGFQIEQRQGEHIPLDDSRSVLVEKRANKPAALFLLIVNLFMLIFPVANNAQNLALDIQEKVVWQTSQSAQEHRFVVHPADEQSDGYTNFTSISGSYIQEHPGSFERVYPELFNTGQKL